MNPSLFHLSLVLLLAPICRADQFLPAVRHAPATEAGGSAKHGNPLEAVFQQATQSAAEGDHAKAAELYRQAADQGHAAAQLCLGKCYSKGEGVTKDHDEAFAWFTKTKGQGHGGENPERSGIGQIQAVD